MRWILRLEEILWILVHVGGSVHEEHVEKGMYLLFGYLYSAFQEFLKLAFSLNSSVNFLNDTSQISHSEINISVDWCRVLYH